MGIFPWKQPATTQFAQDIPHMLIHINIILFLVLSALNVQQPAKKQVKQNAKEVPISKLNKTLTYYIVFESGKTELNNEAKEKLDRIANVFKTNPGDTLNIMPDEVKIALYKERSISVNNYLRSKGVPQAQIRFVEYGKLKAAREIQLILKE
jgi:outer membrane protein OmpA-like peptidoglycan-associated protein